MPNTLKIASLQDVQDHQDERPSLQRPWVIENIGLRGIIKDADGNELFNCAIGVAHLIVCAVNSHSNLVADNAAFTVVARETQKTLRGLERTPAVADSLRLIEDVLHPGEGA